MASRTNPLKTLTLLRKLIYAYEVAEPTINKQRGKLIELLRGELTLPYLRYWYLRYLGLSYASSYISDLGIILHIITIIIGFYIHKGWYRYAMFVRRHYTSGRSNSSRRSVAGSKVYLREKAEKASNSEVARKMRVAKGFYTVEMAPPSSGEIGQIRNDIQLIMEFIKNKCYMHLTVRQAWLLLLVTIEVGLWFFLGETFGKFHIIGYKV